MEEITNKLADLTLFPLEKEFQEVLEWVTTSIAVKTYTPPKTQIKVIENILTTRKIDIKYDNLTDTVEITGNILDCVVKSPPLCICTKERANTGYFFLDCTDRIKFIVIEEKQYEHYNQAKFLNDQTCYFIVLKHNDRGIPFARDMAKVVLSTILVNISSFYMIDDDLLKPNRAQIIADEPITDQHKGKMSWMEDITWAHIFTECESVMAAQKALLVAPTSSKDMRFCHPTMHTYINKTCRPCSTLQQLVLIDINGLKNISYLPKEYRILPDTMWRKLYQFKKASQMIQLAFFQSEDLNFVNNVRAQCGANSSQVLLMFAVKVNSKLPSVAGTIKSPGKKNNKKYYKFSR